MFCCIWYCLLLCSCCFSIKWGWICFAFVHTLTHTPSWADLALVPLACVVIVNCCCALTPCFLSIPGSLLRYTVFACNRKASAPLQQCKIQHLWILAARNASWASSLSARRPRFSLVNHFPASSGMVAIISLWFLFLFSEAAGVKRMLFICSIWGWTYASEKLGGGVVCVFVCTRSPTCV